MNRTTLALAAVSLTLTLAAGVLTPSRSRTAEAPIGTCFDTPSSARLTSGPATHRCGESSEIPSRGEIIQPIQNSYVSTGK